MDQENFKNTFEELGSRLEMCQLPNEQPLAFMERVLTAVVERDIDVASALETLYGKKLSEFDRSENVTLEKLERTQRYNRNIRYAMNGDTHIGMSWNYHQAALNGNGFAKALYYKFKDGKAGTKESFAVWANLKRGTIVSADSYESRKGVNFTFLNYELDLTNRDLLSDKANKHIDDIICVTGGDLVFDDSGKPAALAVWVDAKEGLFEYLKKMDSLGIRTNSPWKFFSSHKLWLFDYVEWDKPGFDYVSVNNKNVKRMPLEVQAMMGYKA